MSEENISLTVDELPTLYLGKDTTVYDNKWDFGNATVHLNNIPTEDNMVTNKSYVDSLFQQADKKIDSILDGASISVENFKNFVDFVNNNQRENEAELYNSIANISNSVIDEKNRAVEVEDIIKKYIDELRNKLDNNNSSGANTDEIKASVQNEVNRANDAENRIHNTIDEVKASVQNEVNRANEAEQNLRTELLEEIKKMGSPNSSSSATDTTKLEEEITALKASEKALQDEINMLKEKMNAIYQYFFRNNATGGNKFNLRI
jgi:polyhydroxyalkanoate synthesis regulator phasin